MTTLEDLYDRRDELQTAIDDAAEDDDGELWEDLNDELEDIEDQIERWEEANAR